MFNHMKSRILSFLASLAFAAFVQGQTAPEYRNIGTVLEPPQIDATSFINGGIFDLLFNEASTGGPKWIGFVTPADYAFRTDNTLNYLNLASGFMSDYYGFVFQFETNGFPSAAQNFENRGTISSTFLSVAATNIIHSGFLIADGGGMVRLEGQNVNLNRGGISAVGYNVGDHPQIYPSDGSELYYFGLGTNDLPADQIDISTLFKIDGKSAPKSPSHRVFFSGDVPTVGGGGFGGFNASLPIENMGTNWVAFVYTNKVTDSNWIIQTILVPTNSGVVIKAGFQTTGRTWNEAVVQFALTNWDVVSGSLVTNYFAVWDRSPTLATNDYTFNSVGDYIGVDGLKMYRGSTPATLPFGISRWGGMTGYRTPSYATNAAFTNTLIYDSVYSNKVVTNVFAAYAANVGPVISTASSGSSNIWATPGDNSVTNSLARIEVEAGNLDLTDVRMQADRYISIRATNLVSTKGAIIDSPYLRLELGDGRSDIVLSSTISNYIKRVHGTIYAYSTMWTNQTVDANTNTVDLAFHVLMVDYGFANDFPVTYESLILHGRNVVLNDNATVDSNLLLDTQNLKLGGTLEGNGLTNWSRINAPQLLNFTNEGALHIYDAGYFGSDAGQPYNYFINSNTNTAKSPATITASPLAINAKEVRNNRGVLQAEDGSVSIKAQVAKLDDGLIKAIGNVDLEISEAKVRNASILSRYGAINLNVPAMLSDGGPAGAKTNYWQSAYGVTMVQKPYQGDLLGTEIRVTPAKFVDVTNRWAGLDYGASIKGYSNNAAIGRLVLNSNYLTRFNFTQPLNALYNSRSAVYVDYLKLNGFDTNVSSLNIASDMTVYFADSNISPDILNGKANGRLVWVPSYAGAFSGTNYTLPGGQTIFVNRALLASSVLDSDGDGIANSKDTNVFGGVKFTEVYLTNTPPNTTVMSWKGAAQTIYQVDYTTDPIKPSWQSLLTVTNTAATNAILTIQDTVTPNSAQRFYRVSYTP